MWNTEKWKNLAWYPNKTWRYRQQNPKCSDWRWTNLQLQVALKSYFLSFIMFLYVFLQCLRQKAVERNLEYYIVYATCQQN